MEFIRAEFVEGTSAKFYEVLKIHGRGWTNWGRIGTEGQANPKEMTSGEAHEVLLSKLRKGYDVVPGAKTSNTTLRRLISLNQGKTFMNVKYLKVEGQVAHAMDVNLNKLFKIPVETIDDFMKSFPGTSWCPF